MLATLHTRVLRQHHLHRADQVPVPWSTTLGLNKIVKVVPAGTTYTTVQRWAKPGTGVFVGYKNPMTNLWVNLDSKVAGRGAIRSARTSTGGDSQVRSRQARRAARLTYRVQ